MKENDGKAHRKNLQLKFILALLSTACVFLATNHYYFIPPQNDDATTTVGSLQAAAASSSLAAHRRGDVAGGGQREKRLSMNRHSSSNYLSEEQIQSIQLASTNLISLEYNDSYDVSDDSYHGIVGIFCTLDFKIQKDNPPETPMFRELVQKSGCSSDTHVSNRNKRILRVDLVEAVRLAREYDDTINGNTITQNLNLKGVVFHESRCGSTLAANTLLAVNPTEHRVYSESTPPKQALKICGEDFTKCSIKASANLLKDVIYMMGRSNDPNEQHFFFKFQSATTRTMEVFRMGFPTTPWIFMYRDPVQVMMSQLDMRKISRANCVRSKHSSPVVKDHVLRRGYTMEDLEDEEFCAVHLATLCDSALRQLKDANGLGLAINYSPDIVYSFLHTLLPHHFNIPLDEDGRERVLKVAGTYSKNVGGGHEKGDFTHDSEEKERKASQEIKNAAKKFLWPSFEELETSRFNVATYML